MKTPPLISGLLSIIFLVCPLIFFTDLTRNPFYTQITLLTMLLCLCWICWLIQSEREKEIVWTMSPLDGPLLLLILVCLLSWGNAFVQHRLLIKPIYSEGSRAILFILVNVYLVYAAAIRFQDTERFKRFLPLVYIVCAIASLYGIAQYFGVEWIWPQNLNPYGNRPVSTFGNPNFMSSYLVLVLPVAIADYTFRITRVPRFALFAVILCSTGALLATLTRSSWAGALLGVIVLFGGIGLTSELWEKVRRPALILFAILFVSIALWPRGAGSGYGTTPLGRLTEISEVSKGPYAPVSQRLLIWLCAWEMLQDHPILGKGWGCFELFYPYYQGPQLFRKAFQPLRTHANNAHDEVLEYASQLGTVGLAVVILLWVVFFKSAVNSAGRPDMPGAALKWGLIGGIAGMLLDNLLNVSLHFAVPAFLFWWWVGTVMRIEPAPLRSFRLPLGGARRTALIGLAGLALVAVMARSACLWAEEMYFFRGFKLSKAGGNLLVAKQDLEKAYSFHHLEVNNNYELGNVDARLGLMDSALFMYQRALDANAGYDEIYFNRATVLMQMGKDAEAIRNYRYCLAINPLSHDAYNTLGSLYSKDLGQNIILAAGLFRQGTELFPLDKDMWNNFGYILTQQKQWGDAYQAYRQAVAVDPEFAVARRNLIVAARKSPGHAQDPLLHLDQEVPAIQRLINDKKWMEARDRLEQLVQNAPRSYTAHFYLGNVLFSMNQLSEATQEYRRALDLRPDAVAAWQNLGVCLERGGDAAHADAAYRRALQLDPKNLPLRQHLHLP